MMCHMIICHPTILTKEMCVCVCRYQAAKKLNIGSLKVFYVAMSLPEQTEKSQKENYFVRGKMVLKTINNFCASSDEEISVYHTPATQICETTGLFEPIPFHVRQVSTQSDNINNYY